MNSIRYAVGSDMEDHLKKLTETRNQLAAARSTMTEEAFGTTKLESLPQSFDSSVTVLDMKGKERTYKKSRRS